MSRIISEIVESLGIVRGGGGSEAEEARKAVVDVVPQYNGTAFRRVVRRKGGGRQLVKAIIKRV